MWQWLMELLRGARIDKADSEIYAVLGGECYVAIPVVSATRRRS